jgi:hypothetical protein
VLLFFFHVLKVSVTLAGTGEYLADVDDSVHLVQTLLPVAVGRVNGSIDPHHDYILMDALLFSSFGRCLPDVVLLVVELAMSMEPFETVVKCRQL